MTSCSTTPSCSFSAITDWAWHKREIYGRGLHVPVIVRYPNGHGAGPRLAGTWDEDLHSFVDLAPSMLSLTGVPIPQYMQGQA